MLTSDAAAQVQLAEGMDSPLEGSFSEMLRLREITDLAISSDGQWVVYRTSPVFQAGTTSPAGRLVLLNLQNHSIRTLDLTGQAHNPQWAPTANTLAFIAPAKDRNTIWLYEALDTTVASRPVPVLETISDAVISFAWSPAGDGFAFLATESNAARQDSASLSKAPGVVLFRDAPGELTGPTSPTFRSDSAGAYVGVAMISTGRTHMLARGLVSVNPHPSIQWVDSETLLVNGAARGLGWMSAFTKRSVYTISLPSRTVKGVTLASKAPTRTSSSPSGRWIAYLDFDYLPDGRRLPWQYSLRIADPAQPGVEHSLSQNTDGFYVTFPPLWSGDNRTLYIARYERGTSRLFAVDVATRRWRALTSDTLSVARYAVTPDGKALVAVIETASGPQEVYRIHVATGKLTRLTSEAAAPRGIRLGRVSSIKWPSDDGRFTVHGFIVYPLAYDSRRRYPLLVLVHGGPGNLYVNSFVDINFRPFHLPAQVLAAAGYMVLLPNPRGDMSYGSAYQSALHQDWAPGPFADVNAGVSALVARGVVDSNAIGIYGNSYGAYLAAYGITQTTRFAAASIDDAPVNLESFYGQNYAVFSRVLRQAFNGTPWNRAEAYAAQSPITFVSRVRTPVLMRYGGRSATGDKVRQSYMLAQGFEFYAGLRDHAVPVEFILHPDQGHGITDWQLYQDWVTRNLRWFGYWLRGEGKNPAASTH